MGTVLLTAQAIDMIYSEVICQDAILAWKEERNRVQIWKKKKAEHIYFLKEYRVPSDDDVKESGLYSKVHLSLSIKEEVP